MLLDDLFLYIIC